MERDADGVHILSAALVNSSVMSRATTFETTRVWETRTSLLGSMAGEEELVPAARCYRADTQGQAVAGEEKGYTLRAEGGRRSRRESKGSAPPPLRRGAGRRDTDHPQGRYEIHDTLSTKGKKKKKKRVSKRGGQWHSISVNRPGQYCYRIHSPSPRLQIAPPAIGPSRPPLGASSSSISIPRPGQPWPPGWRRPGA